MMNTPWPHSQQRICTNLPASNRLPWSIAFLRASRRASSTNCSCPKTQPDTAIRLVSQSTSGEIRSISLHPQASTSKGASVKSSVGQRGLQGLETANPNHFCNLLSGLAVRPLVCRSRTSRPEFACEENQRCSNQAGAAQQPEAIEGGQERSLLIQDAAQLRMRVD